MITRRTNKYNARRSSANTGIFPELAGRSFASQLERDRAVELVLLQRNGDIQLLTHQPKVELTRAKISYRADFYYQEIENRLSLTDCKIREVWEEVKGKEMYPWFTIRKLWCVYGPGLLRVTVRSTRGRIRVKEEICPTG